MVRYFEKVSRVKDLEFNLPQRKTMYSAGYDFECIEDIVIPPFKEIKKPTLVPTGVKAHLGELDYLMLANRSSNPKKKSLVLANGVGIIDSDYYNNPDNEGEIAFAFYNISNEPVKIEKGYCIGQGIIQCYCITDNDNANGQRTGGFGSTNK